MGLEKCLGYSKWIGIKIFPNEEDGDGLKLTKTYLRNMYFLPNSYLPPPAAVCQGLAILEESKTVVVEDGEADVVVLDCPYGLSEEDKDSLLVKW